MHHRRIRRRDDRQTPNVICQTQEAHDLDGALSIAAMVALGVLAVAVLFAAPVLVGGMVTALGFTESQAGFVISAELLAMAVGTIPAVYLAKRLNWRVLLVASMVWMIAVNLLCCLMPLHFGPLLALRIATGIPQGVAMSLCLAMIGMTRKPDRNFGLYVAGQLVFGALALFALPRLMSKMGFGFVYLVVAALLIGFLPLLRYLPRSRVQGGPWTPTVIATPGNLQLGSGLLAIFVYYVGQYGVWVYLDRIGAHLGFAPQPIAETLSFASFVGIAGSGGAVVFDRRFGRILPITVGCGLSVLSMVLLMFSHGLAQYAAAAALFSAMFNFILPYMMAVIAGADQTGRPMMLANFASGAGLAAGPALGALLLNLQVGYQALYGVGIGSTLAALLLIMKLALIEKPVTAAPARLGRTNS